MAHTYFFAGNREEGISASLAYGKENLHLSYENNPDVVVLRYGLFSVDDARRVIRLANQSSARGGEKLIVLAVERLFHEAQNALLKVFEEPAPDTTLVLVVPSVGMLLATLRSRMLPLKRETSVVPSEAKIFIAGSAAEREKLVSKLLDRAKSDKDEDKQAARAEALRLLEGLMRAGYAERVAGKKSEELDLFLYDLDRFIPILHERSAPLKLIFEHLLLTMPPFKKVL